MRLIQWMFGCMGPGSTDVDLEIDCWPDETNALRAVCDIAVTPPGEVTLAWGPPSAPERETLALTDVSETRVTLLWFEPKTTHSIVAKSGSSSATVSLTTGSVPVEVATVYEVTGTSSVDRVIHRSPCADSGSVVISSTDGTILWYQEVVPATSNLVAVKYTEDDTVLVLATASTTSDYNGVREFDLNGTELWSMNLGIHYDHPLHHDVVKKDGLVYALYEVLAEHDGRPYQFDGFYVFDEAQREVASWYMPDHIVLPPDVVENGELRDFSHCNSLWVDDDQNVLISCRSLSSLVNVRGDWTAEDFGEINWWLGGDPGQPFPTSSLNIVSSIGETWGFRQQHHASMFEPDRITVFDNQNLDDRSRLTSMRLDRTTGTVDLDELYPIPLHCSNQGAFYRTPVGNAFGTCADNSTLYEYSTDARAKPLFELKAECATGPSRDVYRYVPLHVGQ